MNKDKKSCGCCCNHDSSYKDELKVDLKKAGKEIQDLAIKAKDKFDSLKPEQKKKLKKNVAIGAGIVAGLWGLKKALGGKKK
jgi:hypothetical protein